MYISVEKYGQGKLCEKCILSKCDMNFKGDETLGMLTYHGRRRFVDYEIYEKEIFHFKAPKTS